MPVQSFVSQRCPGVGSCLGCYKEGVTGAYINGIAPCALGIRVAKDFQEAGHGLQAGEDGRVQAVLHVRDGDGGANQETFPVCPERGLWEVNF